MAQGLLLGSASLAFNDTPIRALRSMTGDIKRGRGFLRALFAIAILYLSRARSDRSFLSGFPFQMQRANSGSSGRPTQFPLHRSERPEM
jgi:hypothetical protein